MNNTLAELNGKATNKWRLHFLILSFLFAVWLFLIKKFFIVELFSRAFTDPVSGGASSYKHMFAIAWACLCCFALSFPAMKTKPAYGALLRNLIAAAMLLSLISHLLFARITQSDFFKFTISATGNEQSSNIISHIHVMKGVIWLLVNSLGLQEIAKDSDPGAVYQELLPTWIFVIGGLLFTSITILFLIDLRRRYLIWDSKSRLTLTVSYIIASLGIVKATIDGGPFDSSAVLGIPIIWCLTSNNLNPQIFSKPTYSYWGMMFVGIILLGTISGVSFGFIPLIRAIMFFVSIYAICELLAERNRKNYLRFFIAVLLFIGFMKTSYFKSELNRIFTVIPKGTVVTVRLENGKSLPMPTIFKDEFMNVYQFTGTEDANLFDIYKKLRLSPGFAIAAIDSMNCVLHNSFYVEGEITSFVGKFIPGPTQFPVKNIEVKKCGSEEYCIFKVGVELPGCFPDQSHNYLRHFLTTHGLQSFTMHVRIPDPT